MATVTIETGFYNQDSDIVTALINPTAPFAMGAVIYAKTFIEGDDFNTGDDIVINFKGMSKIRYVSGIDSTGSNMTINNIKYTGTPSVEFATGSKDFSVYIVGES